MIMFNLCKEKQYFNYIYHSSNITINANQCLIFLKGEIRLQGSYNTGASKSYVTLKKNKVEVI